MDVNVYQDKGMRRIVLEADTRVVGLFGERDCTAYVGSCPGTRDTRVVDMPSGLFYGLHAEIEFLGNARRKHIESGSEERFDYDYEYLDDLLAAANRAIA